jgi:hypothetical protein
MSSPCYWSMGVKLTNLNHIVMKIREIEMAPTAGFSSCAESAHHFEPASQE